ncbi:MAG: hypothetical protein KA004_05055 [Verrucomicrobiales bacterium]|nr:hypothetical protein [Verrucomicrobiales bacterium]
MADTASTPHAGKAESSSFFKPWTDWTWAYLLLRLALGLLLIFSGSDKFKSATSPATYSLDNYYGTEQELKEGKAPKAAKIVNVVYINSGLDNADKLPGGLKTANFFSQVFYRFGMALPWLMIGSGVLILLGLMSRIAHLLGGLVWISLAAGQMMLPDNPTIQMLLFFLLLHVVALGIIKHNRLCLDGRSSSAD